MSGGPQSLIVLVTPFLWTQLSRGTLPIGFRNISLIPRYDGTSIQVSRWNSMSDQPDIIIDIRGGGRASTERN